MDESISVSSVIDKFPPSWKDFKHTLKNGKDDLSLVQLGSHLRIEESLRAHDSDKGKGKEIAGPFVNMTEEGGFGYYNNGHMHYKRMLETSKDNLIHAIDENPEKSERKNRALKKMVNSMLSYSGLSEGFWGEDMLTDFYLLNRVWGCKAVVRLPDPKRKTLDEKGIDCIFVGYAEHSKAYRFYVIEPNDSVSINSIIESKDAIFDENRFSSIPRPNDTIPNFDESQTDDHSNDLPSENLEPRKGKRARKAKSYGSDFQLYLVEGSRDQIGSQ
ncbi:hypothetical protein Tco_0033395 [Tanacetum coccineum]